MFRFRIKVTKESIANPSPCLEGPIDTVLLEAGFRLQFLIEVGFFSELALFRLLFQQS